jgi:hypothetical protein
VEANPAAQGIVGWPLLREDARAASRMHKTLFRKSGKSMAHGMPVHPEPCGKRSLGR